MFIRRCDLSCIVIFQRNVFLIVVSSCYSVIFSLKDLIESFFLLSLQANLNLYSYDGLSDTKPVVNMVVSGSCLSDFRDDERRFLHYVLCNR